MIQPSAPKVTPPKAAAVPTTGTAAMLIIGPYCAVLFHVCVVSHVIKLYQFLSLMYGK